MTGPFAQWLVLTTFWPGAEGSYSFSIFADKKCTYQTTTIFDSMWKPLNKPDLPYCFEVYGPQMDDTPRKHAEDVLYFCEEGRLLESFYEAGSGCNGTKIVFQSYLSNQNVTQGPMFEQEFHPITENQVNELLQGQCVQAAGGLNIKFSKMWAPEHTPSCSKSQARETASGTATTSAATTSKGALHLTAFGVSWLCPLLLHWTWS
eukprot:TRINITY_DN58872_c0_g1_i1.p1 TRINITY_DN58872_c0_g1~~TRINITY_DN58872_c0_g1_i1.p1  ORF type:complete len:205 (+),score=35.38 TRINITY_DN58872_c0_g1_i1:63-677(+)